MRSASALHENETQPILAVIVTDLTEQKRNEAIVAAVAGTKDPKAAADEAATKLTDILKNGGYIK